MDLPPDLLEDLRHTYASLQIAAGANPKYLSHQLGHASVQITLDRYSHLLQDSHPEQAARLSAFVFTGATLGAKPKGRKMNSFVPSSTRPNAIRRFVVLRGWTSFGG